MSSSLFPIHSITTNCFKLHRIRCPSAEQCVGIQEHPLPCSGPLTLHSSVTGLDFNVIIFRGSLLHVSRFHPSRNCAIRSSICNASCNCSRIGSLHPCNLSLYVHSLQRLGLTWKLMKRNFSSRNILPSTNRKDEQQRFTGVCKFRSAS